MTAGSLPEVMTDEELAAAVARARSLIVRVGHAAGGQGAHFGPALSLVEVMTVLYGAVARNSAANPRDPERDRVILSKGHGSLALYAALHMRGYIDDAVLETAEKDGSKLPGQPIRNLDLGIEFSSGSLGMGLAFGVGLALSARLQGSPRRAFVVMGDGETNEGSVWEAAMSAAHFGLGNLVAIVDVNDLQSDGPTSDIMSFNHAAAWSGFGWDVVEVDGHDVTALRETLSREAGDRPRCVLARTVKGKGVSFMENAAEWHHGRLTEAQYDTARTDCTPGDDA